MTSWSAWRRSLAPSADGFRIGRRYLLRFKRGGRSQPRAWLSWTNSRRATGQIHRCRRRRFWVNPPGGSWRPARRSRSPEARAMVQMMAVGAMEGAEATVMEAVGVMEEAVRVMEAVGVMEE